MKSAPKRFKLTQMHKHTSTLLISCPKGQNDKQSKRKNVGSFNDPNFKAEIIIQFKHALMCLKGFFDNRTCLLLNMGNTTINFFKKSVHG